MTVLTRIGQWKCLLVGVAFVLLGVFAVLEETRGDNLERELELAKEKAALNENNLLQLRSLSDDQAKRLGVARVELEDTKRQYAATIALMREQKVPKQCLAAIDFAVKNAGDLRWDK